MGIITALPTLLLRLYLDRWRPRPRDDRGDVPGWVLVTRDDRRHAGDRDRAWPPGPARRRCSRRPQLGAVVVPRRPCRRRDERGAAVVDFVLVLVVLVPLVLGILQVALVLHVRNTLAAAAAEGARVRRRAGRDVGGRGGAHPGRRSPAAISGRLRRRRDRASRAGRRRAHGRGRRARAACRPSGWAGPSVDLEVVGPRGRRSCRERARQAPTEGPGRGRIGDRRAGLARHPAPGAAAVDRGVGLPGAARRFRGDDRGPLSRPRLRPRPRRRRRARAAATRPRVRRSTTRGWTARPSRCGSAARPIPPTATAAPRSSPSRQPRRRCRCCPTSRRRPPVVRARRHPHRADRAATRRSPVRRDEPDRRRRRARLGRPRSSSGSRSCC